MFHRPATIIAFLLICSPYLPRRPARSSSVGTLNHDGKLSRDELPDFLGHYSSGSTRTTTGTSRPTKIGSSPSGSLLRRRGSDRNADSRQMPRIPDSVQAELDVPYAGTDNPRQRLDLFLPKSPKSDKPLPVVAYIHGGGWQSGDKRGGSGLVAPLGRERRIRRSVHRLSSDGRGHLARSNS